MKDKRRYGFLVLAEVAFRGEGTAAGAVRAALERGSEGRKPQDGVKLTETLVSGASLTGDGRASAYVRLQFAYDHDTSSFGEGVVSSIRQAFGNAPGRERGGLMVEGVAVHDAEGAGEMLRFGVI